MIVYIVNWFRDNMFLETDRRAFDSYMKAESYVKFEVAIIKDKNNGNCSKHAEIEHVTLLDDITYM